MKTLETCCRKFLVPLEAFGRQRFKDSKRPLKCPAKSPKAKKSTGKVFAHFQSQHGREAKNASCETSTAESRCPMGSDGFRLHD